jgi:hypothetical protein
VGHPTWRIGAVGTDDHCLFFWLDLQNGEEKHLVRIRTLPNFKGKRNELRVDPHPAWDRDFKCIAFNACPHGKRQVFVVELETVITSH